jgi:hypothetical protein
VVPVSCMLDVGVDAERFFNPKEQVVASSGDTGSSALQLEGMEEYIGELSKALSMCRLPGTVLSHTRFWRQIS